MRIRSVEVYQVDLPLKEGRYTFSDSHSVEVFDTTVVVLSTDEGIQGYGECCPLGSAYLPAYGPGVRAGIRVLAPHLIGVDPTGLGIVNKIMDDNMKGHPYVKSAIDMACWDLLGKKCDQPLYNLLGGQRQATASLYRAISQESPKEMAKKIQLYRDQGYQKFQLKVGGDAATDIDRIRETRALLSANETLVADANTGWTKYEALKVVNAVADMDVHIEQPCPSYEESLAVRSRCQLPFTLDEVITDTAALVRALNDDAMDIVNLKISRLGGITKTRLMRDLCVSSGIPVTLEDAWGGDIVTAAISHLVCSLDQEFYFSSTDFNSYSNVDLAEGAPQRRNGTITASDKAGLGVIPRRDTLGEPCFCVS